MTVTRAGSLMLTLLLALPCFAHDRSEADAARDLTSKPLQVLGFLDVQPGWTVLDMLGGAGYYSEVLASVVGPTGKVYLHNNRAYIGFVKGLDERLQDNRLPNVESYVREVEDIDLKSGSIDMVLMVKAYHDAYFTSDGWTVKPDPMFRTVHRLLKPGGVLAVIDHRAKPGTGSAAAQNLHRIDPAFAKQDIESRGFKFIGSTRILENADDDLTKGVFDEAVLGKTSRFVFKFIKQ